MAVNRPYGKSDYIPCIAWVRNARYASGFGVGTRILIWGRVQSREYTKKVSETECEKTRGVRGIREQTGMRGTRRMCGIMLQSGEMHIKDISRPDPAGIQANLLQTG